MTNDITASLGEALRLLRRGALWSIAVAVVLGYAAYLWSGRQAPVYEAQATVLAAESTADFRSYGVSAVVAPAIGLGAYQVAASSDTVLTQALGLLGVAEVDDRAIRALRSRVSVRTSDSGASSLITVTASSGSPSDAAATANAVADALVEWDVQRATRSVGQIVTALQQQIASLTEQIRSLQALGDPTRATEIEGLITLRAQQQQSLAVARAMGASAVGRLEVLQRANVPTVPVAPRPWVNALLAAIAGIVVTYGIVILRATLDIRLKSVDELEEIAGVPILAEFERMPKPTRRLPREAASYLRTGVLFATADAAPRVVIVTSGRAGEGKSAVSLNLAESFARNDYRTLLVDADLRQPVLHQEYGLRRGNGSDLTDFLRDPGGAHRIARVPIGGQQTLDVIPAFEPVPQAAELLGRDFRTLVDAWSHTYDVIIVDTPPVLAVADALTIAPFATGAILAVNLKRSDRRSLRASLDLLERMGVRLLGVAATMVAEPRVRRAGGYGYEGYGDAPERQRPNAPAPRAEARVSVRQPNRRS